MLLDGKTRYTLDEAAEQTGYTKGTISNYLYKGEVDGDKMEDGQWFVSPTGMVQLRRKKKLPPDTRITTPDKPVISQKEPARKHPEGFKEGSVYVRTKADHVAYNLIKEAAAASGYNLGDMVMAACRYYAKAVLSTKLEELKKIEEMKKSLLMGLEA